MRALGRMRADAPKPARVRHELRRFGEVPHAPHPHADTRASMWMMRLQAATRIGSM